MSIVSYIPGVSTVKEAVLAVLVVVLLAATGYGAYRWYSYSQALSKANVEIAELTANNSTLKANQQTLLETNAANQTALQKFKDDAAAAQKLVAVLAQQRAEAVKNAQALEAAAGAAKGTTRDGPVAPILRDTLRSLQ